MGSPKSAEGASVLASQAGTEFGSEFGDDTDGLADEDPKELEKPKLPGTLQSAFKKLRVYHLVTQRGVKRSLLQEWRVKAKFKQHRSEDQELFISRVLHSGPLMQQSASALRDLLPLFTAPEERQDNRLMDAAVKAFHEIKLVTAQTCWYDHIVKLQREVDEVSIKKREVMAQWKEARGAYLREVALLREQARIRADPTMALGCLDVEFFFEPTQILEDQERKFLTDVLAEKLKMMFETNPQVVETFDLGQLRKLLDRVDSAACAELKAALRKKTEELEEVKLALQDRKGAERAAAPAPLPGGAAGKLLEVMEQQLEDMRASVREDHRSLQQLQEKLEAVSLERDEFESAWKEETSQGLLRQKELERLEAEHAGLQEDLEAAREESRSLRSQLMALEDRARLLEQDGARQLEGAGPGRILRRNLTGAGAEAEAKEGMADNAEGGGEQKEGHAGPEAWCSEGSTLTLQSIRETVPVGEARMEALLEDSDALPDDLREALNEALFRKRILEARCEELEKLLSSCAQSRGAETAEDALAEANHIAEYAECLGCTDSDRTSDGVRICRCGTFLANDAAYCRKCGTEWREREPSQDPDRIIDLGHRFANLDTAHQEAVKRLDRLLKPEGSAKSPRAGASAAASPAVQLGCLPKSEEPARSAGAGASAAESPAAAEGRAAGAAPEAPRQAAAPGGPAAAEVPAAALAPAAPEAKGSEQPQAVADLEEEIARLEREKSKTEAQILVELVEATLPDSELEPDQACTCACAQQLGVAHQLLTRLRLLCTKLVGKLKSIAVENVRMSDALSSTKSLLDNATAAIAQSMGLSPKEATKRLMEGMRMLADTRNRCVFHRLYADAQARQRKGAKKSATLGKVPQAEQGPVDDGDRPCSSKPAREETASRHLAPTPPEARPGDVEGGLLTVTRLSPLSAPSQRRGQRMTLPSSLPDSALPSVPAAPSTPSGSRPSSAMRVESARHSRASHSGRQQSAELGPAPPLAARRRPSLRAHTAVVAGEQGAAPPVAGKLGTLGGRPQRSSVQPDKADKPDKPDKPDEARLPRISIAPGEAGGRRTMTSDHLMVVSSPMTARK